MSKFDFVKEVKQAAEDAPKQAELSQTSKPRQVIKKKTQTNTVKPLPKNDIQEEVTVQVSLPTGQKKQAKRNQRQMTIHEDVYQAAAKYAKKEGMSVSRLFETVMAQALKVDVD